MANHPPPTDRPIVSSVVKLTWPLLALMLLLPSAALAGPESREMALLRSAPTIRPAALEAALAAWDDLNSRGEVSRPRLTVIDYSLSSTTKRMWVFDLVSCRLLFHELEKCLRLRNLWRGRQRVFRTLPPRIPSHIRQGCRIAHPSGHRPRH